MKLKWMAGAVTMAAVGAATWLTTSQVTAQRGNRRVGGEAVGSTDFRTTSGMLPSETLLFNGWGITPTGQHVKTSDMPLKMVVAPDGKTLVSIHGGFNDTGVTLTDLATKRVTQFLPLDRAWNGIAFNKAGDRLFAAGGSSGELHVFSFANGKATPVDSASPAPDEKAADNVPKPRRRKAGAPPPEDPSVFLASIAVHPETGKLYVCNEANHEIWIVDPVTLDREATIGVGQHPHTCTFGADRRHLYVSNWGSRSVSVIDTKTNRRVRDINVGRRPNDMTLSKDGRLFVACAGDNTVYAIQTRGLERPDLAADPSRRPPEGTREILSTSLYPTSPEGSTPDGVAVSPDGKTLYVANADNNNVLVADISEPTTSRVEGFIPVGWYPTAVAVSPDGGTLFVGDGKGL